MSLTIDSLRVFPHLRMDPGRDVNWIDGVNGSGKTTLLEAIYLLARGRSFRRSRHGPINRVGTDVLRVSAVVENDGVKCSLSFTARSGKKKLCVDGSQVRRVRDLRSLLQVRVVTENSQALLESQPEIRRSFMDWNLFHVEQEYADRLQCFKRVYLQRNAWLRNGGKGFPVWDDKYVAYAESISESRERFVSELNAEVAAICRKFERLPAISITLQKGWSRDRDLRTSIVASRESDIKRGYTQIGPSRADLRILVNGVSGIGSRGQSKMVATMLQIAAQRVSESANGEPCIWLLDDLRSELDSTSHLRIWHLFEDTGHQLFVTDLEGIHLPAEAVAGRNVKMFHVEQGALIAAKH